MLKRIMSDFDSKWSVRSTHPDFSDRIRSFTSGEYEARSRNEHGALLD
jgi:hypothetical protein